MFEDTPDAMAEWVAAGRRVAIFSSGSREAILVADFPDVFFCVRFS